VRTRHGDGGAIVVVQETVPGYNASDYTSERWTATARDGTEVPMSAVCRTDRRAADVPQAVHLYGYGSYGYALNPEFSSSRLALLDRGVVHVTAHVRGSSGAPGTRRPSMPTRHARLPTFSTVPSRSSTRASPPPRSCPLKAHLRAACSSARR